MKLALIFSTISIWLMAVFAAFVPTVAHADSWDLPRSQTEVSPNGLYRFSVEPSPLESQLSYFEDELEAERNDRAIERVPPIGLLERKAIDGTWQPVWSAPLVNAVAPVSLVVADDGAHVATFDNWHSIGHGETVIVLYGSDGALVRSLALSDLLPEDYIEALPHSVSSLRWRSGAGFASASDRLLVDILVPDSESENSENTLRFAISLEDGRVIAPPAEELAAAQQAVDRVTRAREEAEAEELRRLRAPLSSPTGCDMAEWHGYLREAVARTTPNWLDRPVAATEILFPPDNPRFDTSVGWLVEAIEDEVESPGEVAIASPCSQSALIAAMRSAFDKIAMNALRQSILYISTDAQSRSVLEGIVKPSGARVIWLERGSLIPQRPERVPGSQEKAKADAERARRADEEMDNMMEEIFNEFD